MSNGVTVCGALAAARDYWDSRGPSSRMMSIRAYECAKGIPGGASGKLRGMQGVHTKLEDLGPPHGAAILNHLRRTGLSKGSVASYYAAFKRAVELAGGDCRRWPKAGAPPRRCREPLTEQDLDRLDARLRSQGYHDTADLLELLRGTGMRVEVEALSADATLWDAAGRTLRITGKGGHERLIPVARLETIALLNDPERLRALRRMTYSGHLKRRWQPAVEALGISSLKPTPHAVRHYYATRAYDRSGHNLRAVQELLGHADINTTARYLGVDVEQLRAAVG